MKLNFLKKGWKGIALISIVTLFSSCDGQLPGMPDTGRKKMPRYSDNGIQQSNGLHSIGYSSCGLASELELITLDVDGKYYNIQLSDSEIDASIFAMADIFKPLASGYLSEWAKTQNKGVVLDLRSSHSGASTREEYRLENTDQFSVPVVLVWNATSALRAKRFTTILNDLPGINSTRINGTTGNF